MIKFRLTVQGTAPLIVHNARLADKLDPVAKAIKKITDKRKKTDDDLLEVARLEHFGGLYLDPDVGPYLPGQNFERCLLDTARLSRQGKTIERGLFIETMVNPLAYTGPRDPDGLWADENFRFTATVVINRRRVSRCRPIFRQWACEARGMLDPSQMDFADLQALAVTAGQLTGMGEWRPRYGRFEATVETI